MPLFRRPSKDPLWRDEFSVFTADERYVSRRQLVKFLSLTSLGMFVGNLWILVRSWLYREPVYPLSEGLTTRRMADLVAVTRRRLVRPEEAR